VPPNVEGSVSTLPGGFKLLINTNEERKSIRAQPLALRRAHRPVSAQTGRKLHLGLEPEPMCLLETTGEVVQLFDRLRAEHRNDPRLAEHLGVNYDTCHLAVDLKSRKRHRFAATAPNQAQQDSPQLSAETAANSRSAPGIGCVRRWHLPAPGVVRQADGNKTVYLDLGRRAGLRTRDG